MKLYATKKGSLTDIKLQVKSQIIDVSQYDVALKTKPFKITFNRGKL